MVLRKDAILTIIKSTDATMQAAKFQLTSPKNPGEDEENLVFTGMLGEVTLKQDGNVLSIICKKNDGEATEVSQVLFDYESEDWDTKDSKSVANEISEAVATYYKTEIVYDNADTKKSDKNKSNSSKNEAVETAPKKKPKKDSVVTYEAVNLANRMENIYPELKGEIDKNIQKYEMFLPEEYFENLANPRIVSTIETEDRQTMKKIFNAFNIFYEEGENDVQSLVAVSILGVNFAKSPELYDKSESYLEDDLKDAVKPIMDYLKTSSGKRALKHFNNPQPYKSKRLKKLK